MVAAGATKLSPAKKPVAIEPRIKNGEQFKWKANPNCKTVSYGTNVREKTSSFHRSKNLDHQKSLEKSTEPPQSLPTNKVLKLKGKLPVRSLLPTIVSDEERLIKEVSAKKQGSLRTDDFSNGTDKEVDHRKVQTGHRSVLMSESRPSNIRLRSHGPLQNEEEKQLKMPKFLISLTPREIEQDFFAMTGEKPPRKTHTRGKIFQKKLMENLPGTWLHQASLDSYNVFYPANPKKVI